MNEDNTDTHGLHTLHQSSTSSSTIARLRWMTMARRSARHESMYMKKEEGQRSSTAVTNLSPTSACPPACGRLPSSLSRPCPLLFLVALLSLSLSLYLSLSISPSLSLSLPRTHTDVHTDTHTHMKFIFYTSQSVVIIASPPRRRCSPSS